MFASSIPEIIELVGSGSKYSGELKREHGKRYSPSNTFTFVLQSFNLSENYYGYKYNLSNHCSKHAKSKRKKNI